MIVKNNIVIKNISWLKNVKTGSVKTIYYPETLGELQDICLNIWGEGKEFFLFGHTSNSYFYPTFSPEFIISTLHLNKFEDGEDFVYCQCGAHIKTIARVMVDLGVEGFYGLIDLPGTIGAAVYGNAGCFGCETSDIFLEAEVLMRDGRVIICNKEDVNFTRRGSALKRKDIDGVILSVKLKKKKGNISEIKSKADEAHRLRVKTQPGAQNNLGSCFSSGERTFFYKVLQKILRIYLKLTKQPQSKILPLTLIIMGYKHLIPYLHDMNRFIWIDEKASVAFEDYVRLYKYLHTGANMEINIYK